MEGPEVGARLCVCVWGVVAWAGLGLRCSVLWGAPPALFPLRLPSGFRDAPGAGPLFPLSGPDSVFPLSGRWEALWPNPRRSGQDAPLLQALSPRGSPRCWAAPGHSRACARGQPGALPGRRGLPFAGL